MELIGLGRTPISDQQPTGADVRYEPSFEQLENEFAKSNSPSADGTVLWDKVVALSSDILANQSKDLLVACYLAAGLMKQDGLEGLAVGIHILKDIIGTYWDTLFPPVKRIRGRINAIEWFVEKVEESISDIEPVIWPAATCDAFFSDLSELDNNIHQYMDNGPVLLSLESRLTELISSQPADEGNAEASAPSEEKQEPVTSATAPKTAISTESRKPSPPKPAVATPAETVPSGVNMDDVPKRLIKQGLELLGGASTALMKQEPLTPLPFTLNRFIAWLPIRQLPPATEGKTLLPPPDEQVISSLESMLQSRSWRELLVSAESRVRQYLFWLDLHRYVAVSLEQLHYQDIAGTVITDTGVFMKRLPGIENLMFSDGRPFASGETRDWLREATSDNGHEQSAMPVVSGDEVSALIVEEFKVAQGLIAEQKTKQAMDSFREHINRAASQKERYLWEIALCRLVLRAKQPRVALPFAHRLLDTIDRYSISEWDPALALEGFATILSVLNQQADSSIDTALVETVINRISVIDPARAMEYVTK